MISNKAIARSFIEHKIKRDDPSLLSVLETEIVNTLLVESSIVENEYNFDNLLTTFSSWVNDIPAESVKYFSTIIERTLEEETLCWGRIVVTFAYAGYITLKYVNDKSVEIIDDVINILGELVDTKAASWIENVGGWKNFLGYVKKEHDALNSILTTVILGCISIYVLKLFFIKVFF